MHLGLYLGAELLGCMVCVTSALVDAAKQFPQTVVPVFTPTSTRGKLG